MDLGDAAVTIELSRETISTALDRACEQIGCSWRVEAGDARSLRIFSSEE